MIIYPYSLTSILIAIYLQLSSWITYKHHHLKIHLVDKPIYKGSSQTYFIIKSRFLTYSQIEEFIQNIRVHSPYAPIILIGRDIDYDDLLKKHYRVFGVIDTTNNKSLNFIREQIHFYLDGIYGLKKK